MPIAPSTTQGALINARVIWAALLLGQISFAVVVIALQAARPSTVPPSQTAGPTLAWISLALLLVLVPVGYIARQQIYKRGWEADAITPQAYLKGNLILWALCEVVSMKALIACLLGGFLTPAAIAGAAVLVQLINFPTGKPMEFHLGPDEP